MAEVVPINIPILTPKFQGTYDYVDTFTGVGYIAVYPCGSMDDTTKTYLLTTNATIGSDALNFSVVDATFDLDFDLKITQPFKIANALCFAIFMQDQSASGITTTIRLRHFDGTTETELGSGLAKTTDGGTVIEKKTIQFTATRKLFKKGDTLRISASATKDAGSTTWYFDPAGRKTSTETTTSATISTQCVVLIPVELPY